MKIQDNAKNAIISSHSFIEPLREKSVIKRKDAKSRIF